MTCQYDPDGDGNCAACRLEGYACGGDGPTVRLEGGDMQIIRDNPPGRWNDLDLFQERFEGFVRAGGVVGSGDLADFFEPFVGEVTYGCRTTVAHWDGEYWVVEDVDPPSNL